MNEKPIGKAGRAPDIVDSFIDMQAWAVALCTLLDLIEASADDEEEVRRLCTMRFSIAERYGMTVEFKGLQEPTIQ